MGAGDNKTLPSKRAYADASAAWVAGMKTEDELLQRIWNLASDVIELQARVEAVERDLRQANFFRDKLAERLTLVGIAESELDAALRCDERADPSHWRDHARGAMETARDCCRKATKGTHRVPTG